MLWKYFGRPPCTTLCRWSNLPSIDTSIQMPVLAYTYKLHHCIRHQSMCNDCHTSKKPVLMNAYYLRTLHSNFRNNFSTSEDAKVTNDAKLPTKEHLLYVDWLTDTLVPKFLSDRQTFITFMKLCTRDVVYDDSIFIRHTEGVDEFIRHVSLSQLYFSLMRAASRFEKLGSCIYEHKDVVIVLWRFTAIKLYHQQEDVTEGALEFHLNENGRIYRIINRPISRDDREDAALLLKLKEAITSETNKELSAKIQMQTVWRYLRHFASPSSANVVPSRAYSTERNNRGPEMFQLEHVRKRLEATIPQFFRDRPDYTFYRIDVEYKDEIFQTTIISREKLMIYFGTISVICQFCFPHIEMEALSILPVPEDGTVRLRWRVKHISLMRSLMNPMLFKYDYRIKRLHWYDGLTIFYVGTDGLVYRVITRKIMEDERKSANKNRLADLVQKVGVLPKGSTAFVIRLGVGEPPLITF